MSADIARLHAEALAEGYKDETCSRCSTEFLAHIHFIRCAFDSCPMRSTKDPRALLEQFLFPQEGETP